MSMVSQTTRTRPPAAAAPLGAPQRIALCVADFPNLGDHLALLPLYHGLRRSYPGSRILLASRYPQAALAQRHGFVDDLVLYDHADWSLLRSIRRFAPQLSICLRRRSARARLVFGRASGAAVSIALEGPLSFLSTDTVRYLANVYRPYRYLEALQPIGPAPTLIETVAALAGVTARDSTPRAFLIPAGSHPDKQWGAERYAAAAAMLARSAPDLQWHAVIGAREHDQGLGAALAAAVPGLNLLVDRPLPELAQLFLDARLVISNDCGPGNLAQMAGAPVLIVFGNWDGGVQERIGWWFDRRPGALCLTTRDQAPIGTIGVPSVVAAARELLADATAAGVRYVES
jgi:ADP-heptose:LPS heptosyltransferase